MQTEESGLEVLSGCFALAALVFAAGGGALWRLLWARRARRAHDDLVRLMTDFLFGVDQSQARVTQIHTLLLNHFLHDSQYEELMTAVASFVPGGAAPFLDEAGLSEVFRVFLRKRRISVPEAATDQPGVWPPPPKR
jgi:hypothetical protein